MSEHDKPEENKVFDNEHAANIARKFLSDMEGDPHMERMPARMRAFKELRDIADVFLKIQHEAEGSGLQPQSKYANSPDGRHQVIFDTGYLVMGRGRTMAQEAKRKIHYMTEAQLGPAQGSTIVSIINDKEAGMVDIDLQLFRENKPIVLEGDENLPVPAHDLLGRSDLVVMAEHPPFLVNSERLSMYMTEVEDYTVAFPDQHTLVDRYLSAASEGKAPEPYYLSDEESENFVGVLKDSMPILAEALSYVG